METDIVMKTPAREAAESHPMAVPEGNAPSLWPPELTDETPIKRALESCQKENQSLKVLVVHLSEMVIRHIAGKN
jgi:hypothetical protein